MCVSVCVCMYLCVCVCVCVCKCVCVCLGGGGSFIDSLTLFTVFQDFIVFYCHSLN